MASRPPVNQYFNDDPLERNIREEMLRNIRWQSGEGVEEKDIGVRGGIGLGGQLGRPVLDLRNDPRFTEGPTADLLAAYQGAPLFGVTGSQSSEVGGLFATPGASYRLMVGGKEVGTASTPQEMEALARLASEAGTDRKADIAIQTRLSPEGDWRTTFENRPDVSGAGVFADFALPAIGVALAPLTGGASKFLTTALGAAAGSGLSSALQGRSLQESLLRAGLTGLTAGGIGELTSGLSGKVGGAAGGKLSAVGAGETLGAAFDPSTLTAADLGLGQLAGLGGGFAAPVATSALEPMLTVTAGKLGGVAAGGALPGFAGGIAGTMLPNLTQFITNPPAQQPDYGTEEPEAVGTAPRIPKPTIPPAAFAVPAAAAATAAQEALSQAAQQAMESETTTSQRADQQIQDGTSGTAAAAAKGLTAAEIARLGLGGLTALQGIARLFGGGGSGSGSPGIGGGFNETVSFQPLNRTRNVATFDPFTYGQSSGEFRFFGNERPVFQVGIGSTPLPAPIAPTTPGPDAGIAPQPEPVNKKRGGPIRGIGGGQDDKIPAMLSDGEYVFSAQDVADLGDGSNDEGARRLDEMRKLIRKQAGRRNTKTIAKPQKSVSSLLRAAR
jgi:hypothetical protein